MKSIKNSVLDSIPNMLPVVPTMDVVVFPNQIVPLLVLDERIINGINQAIKEEPKYVLLVASKKQSDNHYGAIGTKDLYDIGTVATIMRLVKIPEGGIKILAQGVCKAKISKITSEEDVLNANVEFMAFDQEENNTEVTTEVRKLKEISEKISASGYSFSPDFHIILSKMNDPEKLADFILSHLSLKVDQAQELLEHNSHADFLNGLHKLLSNELQESELQENIKSKARESMNKSQKEFFLREQIRAIKKELGEDDYDEIDKLREKADSLSLSEEVKSEVNRQLNRLEKTSPDSMEATVTRNHIECILSLPWNINTEDNLDITRAKNTLDEDHYGLKEIKERILDFISIKQLKNDSGSPILCFVGPPGTGKTSLGKSIARSLGREFFRISLGGVKDEAEIRGHRRTYVGAMPGRLIQGIKKAGSSNPVIIIDELDKIGSDFRGDPSAAMLEVLDPQQNKTFYDNYLGVPFDLSKVIFIATANSLETISGPLRDRLEIIELSGYTIAEKTNIAQKYLVSKALADAGLKDLPIEFSESVIESLITNYTRESGVRELERIIKKLCSKAARSFVETKNMISLNTSNLELYLGPKKFIDDLKQHENHIGISTGLAWTSFGGEVLKIEAVVMPGKGKLLLTGSLGDVMKESAQAALSYVKSHSKEFEIDPQIFHTHDLHIHVPSGAIPKDGPSAGVALLSALLSALTDRPISSDYAMTGEINLRGNVMPIGGVKEKILAAKRNNVPYVILPDQNRNDLIGAEEIAQGINVIWVKHANEIISKVLLPYDKTNIANHLTIKKA